MESSSGPICSSPIEDGEYPTLLSYGPYGKGLAFQEGYKSQWDYMIEKYPEVAEDTSNEHQNWEVVDPERWVPAGYVCARVDSRGTGRSPGYVDVWSGRETVDLYDCIEWAASQPWSNGRIGLAGISYYAMNQYQVAALQPPHLAAICPWEGASDWYRDFARHGGILCEFAQDWYPRQVENVQHGVGERGFFSAVTGESVSGPDTEAPEVLASRRADLGQDVKSRPLFDAWHLERNPDWSRVRTPMLSAANWGGQGLHLRGNVEAFTQSAATDKWLEVHGDAHWVDFYTDRGVALQRRFFDYYLKGEDNGWGSEPRVQLRIRHVDGTFTDRAENEWPLARTTWTRYHLTGEGSLAEEAAANSSAVEYDATGERRDLHYRPATEEMELTGPMAARIFVSSETADADLFLVVRVFDPDGCRGHVHGRSRPQHPDRPGLAARLTSGARPVHVAALSGRITPTTGSNLSSRARPMSWKSRSGPPPSSSPPDIVWLSPFGATTIDTRVSCPTSPGSFTTPDVG